MSHLLWQHFWNDDVDKFRNTLGPHSESVESRGTGQVSSISSGLASSPSAQITRAEINCRDRNGLNLLLRAAASPLPTAYAFVSALASHPALDLHVQDLESGWNALHRSLYAGNVSVARLLLQLERRQRQTLGFPASTSLGPALLFKVKDHEGKSPFQLYNATLDGNIYSSGRSLKVVGALDSASESENSYESENDSALSSSLKRARAVPNLPPGDELFIFGSNKNLSLGVGDADDRQYPEHARLNRPDYLLAEIHYQECLNRSIDTVSQGQGKSENICALPEIPALVHARPLLITDIVMSKFHTAVVTADPFSNLYVCGVGRGGRLGLGHEDARLKFVPVQGALALKRVSKVALGLNHTMAIVNDHGELWTWGLNSSSQLGYFLPASPRPDEEFMSTSPRQVFGALKKESVQGIAASSHHSVAHTAMALYCWGRNVGQLGLVDSDSRNLSVQSSPRRVAASLFPASIRSVSATDRATICLLANHTVCVLIDYGYNYVKFPDPVNLTADRAFAKAGYMHRRRHGSPRDNIKQIASGGDTIVAINFDGDLFALSLRAADAPHSVTAPGDSKKKTSVSTTNPVKIRSALTIPQMIWRAVQDEVVDVSVGEGGSVIICTESGAVWKRVERATPRTKISANRSISHSHHTHGTRPNDFKFQRVPSITGVVSVSSSTSGAYGAIRKDCDIMKQRIHVDAASLWTDIASLLPLAGFKASTPPGAITLVHSQEADSTWPNSLVGRYGPRLGLLPIELMKSTNIEADLMLHFGQTTPEHEILDIQICTSCAPEIRLPVHGWALAGRSSHFRTALVEAQTTGSYHHAEAFKLEIISSSRLLITLFGVDVWSLVNILVYVYTDALVPVWILARELPEFADRYRQVRVEVIKLAVQLNMLGLETLIRSDKLAAQIYLDQDLKAAIRSSTFFVTANVLVQLKGAEVPVHRQLVCRRCPFFDGMFNGHSRGLWAANRKSNANSSTKGLVPVDLKHISPTTFKFILEFIYADSGVEMFDEVATANLEEFTDRVMDVMSVANELMLERLSQICQCVMGRFVTTRNICGLLNEISPCSVTRFKNAAFAYLCLQMETMLENCLLDEIDDDLLVELDRVVNQIQKSCSTVARGGERERALHARYPDLAEDICAERRRLAREVLFKVQLKGDDRRFSSSFRSRFGSLDDGSSLNPIQNGSQSCRTSRNEPQSPELRPRISHDDLMFSMEADSRASPQKSHTEQEHWSNRNGEPDMAEDDLHLSLHDPTGYLADSLSRQSTVTQSRNGSPWTPILVPSTQSNLLQIMSEASSVKTGLVVSSSSLPKHVRRERDAKFKTPQLRVSQKERKRQHQSDAKAQSQSPTHITQLNFEYVEADRPNPLSILDEWKIRENPWKTMSPTAVPSSVQLPVATQLVTESPSNLVVPGTRVARTAPPDTRFPGQWKQAAMNAVDVQAPQACSQGSVVTMPAVPGRSMTGIIWQQEWEKESAREAAENAAARRPLQDIQCEQEFQEWWDQESRRFQVEEVRRLAREAGTGGARNSAVENKHRGSRRGGRPRRRAGGVGDPSRSRRPDA